jgi:hypothetical protein
MTLQKGMFTIILPFNSDFAPGFALSHATHLVESALFCTRHTSQSQLPSGFLNFSNPRQTPEDREAGTVLLLKAGTELPKKNGGELMNILIYIMSPS